MKHLYLYLLIILILPLLSGCTNSYNESKAFIPGHSHNDYYQNRPLFDALDSKLISIEVDIFLVDGKLLVGHDEHELTTDRTIESLYLEPLRKYVLDNNGIVYSSNQPLILLVDIKSNGLETYKVLHETLADFSKMLVAFVNGIKQDGAVHVLISGNRPIDYIRNQPIRYASIDGRLSDLNKGESTDLFPLISTSWRSHFSDLTYVYTSSEVVSTIASIVEQTHSENKMIRFWASPDNKRVWRILHENRVDLINTDKPGALYSFFQSMP